MRRFGFFLLLATLVALPVSAGAAADEAIPAAVLEKFGPENTAAWSTNILDWRTSPVDLSFLNKSEQPAGKHGFLKASGDRLVFEDGAPGRFWGTTLTASALFGTNRRDDIRAQAQRLSQLGFNLVRFTHHDSDWVHPNIFANPATDTRKLNEQSLQNLDWWIKCLKDEGIYVALDLEVGRRLTAADGIEGFDEIKKGNRTAQVPGYNYVNPSIQSAMQRFDDAYVGHVNKFTGLAYKDDPAIVAVLVTNENDVTNHFGNALLPDKNVPWHNARYMARAAEFAQKNGLSKDQTWRSWQPGPSKIFLNDLEHTFNVAMIDHLRGQGVKALIITTDTWGGNPLSSLPSLTDSGLINVHSYGGIGEIGKNPLRESNMMQWMAAAQILGRPVSINEWNVEPFPVPDRDTIPLYISASASLQGFDALMQFAYSQQPLSRPAVPDNWEAASDPALIATMPAAALLYRRGDVAQARTTYVFAPTPAQLFGQDISAGNSVALRTAAEKGRLTIAMPKVAELPWLTSSEIPASAIVIHDPQQSLLASGAEEAVSDTGELKRNWQKGIYEIETPRTQAAMGWIGSRAIKLKDVEFDVKTRNATVAVQSLDDRPIREASALMISLGARSNVDAKSATTYWSEPVIGELRIRARPGLKLYKRAGGHEMQLPMVYADNQYRITLGADFKTYWLTMR
jgi:hypothetical protein